MYTTKQRTGQREKLNVREKIYIYEKGVFFLRRKKGGMNGLNVAERESDYDGSTHHHRVTAPAQTHTNTHARTHTSKKKTWSGQNPSI